MRERGGGWRRELLLTGLHEIVAALAESPALFGVVLENARSARDLVVVNLEPLKELHVVEGLALDESGHPDVLRASERASQKLSVSRETSAETRVRARASDSPFVS